MRIISKRRLREFWEKNPDAKQPLLAWYREAAAADWEQPAAVKEKYRHVSFVGDRAVFNIKGNTYRLVVQINYDHKIIYVRIVCSHKEYDLIDVREV